MDVQKLGYNFSDGPECWNLPASVIAMLGPKAGEDMRIRMRGDIRLIIIMDVYTIQ